VVGLGLLAGIVMAEAVLWLTDIRPPGTYSNVRYANDPTAGPWPLPSQIGFLRSTCLDIRDIHFNRFGMRDIERTEEPRGFRIALVGDSMLEGHQVADDQTVARRLEIILGGATEVLNFGVSSVGTAVELLRYRKLVRRFRPDVVLLLFTVGNDVADNLPEMKRYIDPGSAVLSPYWLLDERGELRRDLEPGRARTTSWLRSTFSGWLVGQWMLHAHDELRRFRLRGEPGWRPGTGPPRSDLTERAWVTTEQLLLRFSQEVRTDGGRFGLVVIPSGIQLLGQRAEIDLDTRTALARLTPVAERAGFPMLDLAREFESRVRRRGRQSFSYPCDDHWNPTGHAVAAEALAAFLRDQGWQ
jgi:hypothetical protein